MSVSIRARIGSGCKIAATAIIYDNVILGDNCEVGEFVILGQPTSSQEATEPLNIGDGAIIRSHCVMYEGSTFGPDLRVGHGSMLRDGLKAGTNLQVGSLNMLEGEATFGDWVRLHSNVHISRGTVIGDIVWIFPYVVTTNDPIPPSGLCEGVTIGDGAVVCTSSIILPGYSLAVGAFVGALSRVSQDVPVGGLYVGNPGKLIGPVTRLRHKPSGIQHPWYGHHNDAYPEAAQNRIRQIARIVENACDQWQVD